MERGRSSYTASNRINPTCLVRGRLGGGHLFTKETPVLGRRPPPFATNHQPSPLAAASPDMNGSRNYLAPPQLTYQQLPQVSYDSINMSITNTQKRIKGFLTQNQTDDSILN